MRRWIVEETGEVRIPREGEYFLNLGGIINFDYQGPSFLPGKLLSLYPILRITEVTDIDKVPWFDDWF